MKQKIGSVAGRAIYDMPLAIVEPPFANIRHAIGLDLFTLRSKRKVNTQWNLFCIVHNLTKIQRYIERFIKLILLKGERILDKGRLSYIQKLQLIDSFGIIDGDLIACHRQLNKLRHKMAHELGYEITKEDVDSIGSQMGKTYARLKDEREDNLKNLLCAVIGFICGGLAHYVVEYEALSAKKRMEIKIS